MDSRIFISFLFVIFGMTAGLETGNEDCPAEVKCACANGKEWQYKIVQLNTTSMEDVVTGVKVCPSVLTLHQACANIFCFYDLDTSDSPKIAGRVDTKQWYPKVIEIVTGNITKGSRFVRHLSVCPIKELKNAIVTCYRWPNWMNCDIQCLGGYAAESADRTTHRKLNINCRYSENYWKPHGFHECESYMSCQAKLISPGELHCFQPNDAPPYCEISCLGYNDYEATDLTKYECTDEDFGELLPHCAILVEKENLIQPPED